MTHLWQEEKGKKYYRIQTDDKEIANKMNRRKGFKLTARSVNRNLWIYIATFSRPDIAKKTIQSLTKKEPKIDSEGVIFYE